MAHENQATGVRLFEQPDHIQEKTFSAAVPPAETDELAAFEIGREINHAPGAGIVPVGFQTRQPIACDRTHLHHATRPRRRHQARSQGMFAVMRMFDGGKNLCQPP